MTNDQKMLGLARGLTLLFCGPDAAANFDVMKRKLLTEEEWLKVRWKNEVEVTKKARFISDHLASVAPAGCDVRTAKSVAACLVVNKRDLWTGLALWVIDGGGTPTLWGQPDKALHYIFGGWIEATTGLGRQAGVLKERLDRELGIGHYDEEDMRATDEGALAAS